jgi:hypothetical protein
MQDYKTTDQLLHQLSQLIAKVNKAYLPQEPDDSHTNLYFDEIGMRITGRWFSGEDKGFLTVFDLMAWEYQIIDESLNVIARISQHEKTVGQTRIEMSSALEKLGFSVDKLADPLHFEIPDYIYSTEAIFRPKEENILEWGRVRAQSNQFCRQFLGFLQKKSEIRIWPHHFDTGVYIEFNAQIGLGFGLAMADSMMDKPYYYLSAYSLKDKSWNWGETKRLRTGKWIINENWKGAVWAVEEIPSNKGNLLEFVSEPLRWYLAE